ncbi:hypothetical protein FACS189485_18250 [Spirochaetia bacterium]|nr:hypothetical protein FACS189485_18250 [Spirochaetia bacterium]
MEIQVKKTDDDLKARALLLGAKLLAGQMKRGGKYEEAKRVYQIFFLNCELFPESDKVPRRYFTMEEREHDKLSNGLEIILYEMPKPEKMVQKYLEGTEDLRNLPSELKWCIYFRYKRSEKMEPLIEELCKQEEGIMMADRALARISRDQEKWARALFREKAAMDYSSGIYAAGKAAHMEDARKMKADSLPLEKIQKYTGLSPEDIEKL